MQDFDPTQYKLDYPQFASLSDNVLINIYTYEALPQSPWTYKIFSDEDNQYYWSCIVLSHILTLTYGATGNGAMSPVGRLSSMETGSVSGQFEYRSPIVNGEAWWVQTQYGNKVWSIWCQRGVMTYVAAC